ncbi:MAG: ABC transporter ATP-binding protein [Roseiarcus sp.]
MSSLRVERLHAHYGRSHVLQGVDFEISRGEMVCILGRNGVGKSTTMKAIMGMVKATSGTIRLNGVELSRLDTHRIARLGIGYVPEERRIFPTITVRENLLMGAKRGLVGEREPWTMDRVFDAFPTLRERANQRAGTLSGGEQQMLTMGRTLMGNPDIVLVDEPTEGLAPSIVERVVKLLVEMHRSGVGVLLVEQTMETALALAERVYVMAKGTMVFAGTRDDLQADRSVRRTYLEV